MLHKTDPSKNFKDDGNDDWKGRKYWCYFNSEFYKIDELDIHGFIHDDGSIRFEFQIKKQN